MDFRVQRIQALGQQTEEGEISMRIYLIHTEHMTYGRNWANVKVAARTCEEAMRLARKEMGSRERVESVELLAATD